MKACVIVIAMLMVFVFMYAGCGGSSGSSNGGDTTHSCGDYPHDSLCAGPAVGQSPNDNDNTFRSLAVHPIDPNTVMIGSEGNGIFKSTDGGATWSRVNGDLCYVELSGYCSYPEIYELIYDVSDATKIYAATTSGPGVGGPAGFFYSTDAGVTWTRSNVGLHNLAVTAVAQDPSTAGTLYIGLDNGVTTDGSGASNAGHNMYKSTDSGLNWSGLDLPVTDNRIAYVEVAPSDVNNIYSCGYSENATSVLDTASLGFGRSADAGATWSRINTGITSYSNPSLTMDPNTTTTLYSTAWTDEGAQSFKTTDGGGQWTTYPEYSETTPNGLAGSTVSPYDPNTILAYTTQKLYITTDGGSTWAEALDLSSAGVRLKKIVFTSDPDTVYVAGDQLKIYKSIDGGATFSAVAGDIQTMIGH